MLIGELDTRMQRDCRRLRRWRHFHRLIAILQSVILIIVPSLLAIGLISPQSFTGKILLMSIVVTGGLSATFRPYTHSYRRRAAMNTIYRLRDEFRAEVAKAETAGGQQATIEVYEKYSQEYANLYGLRGKELVEATLSMTEQREIATKELAGGRPTATRSSKPLVELTGATSTYTGEIQ
jgi:hypothetical protein